MNSTNTKIKKVNFIKKETYEKVIKEWDLLSTNAQVLIKSIFDEAENYENLAIKKAYENNSDFKNKFKSRVNNLKKSAMQKIEKDDEEKSEGIDELLFKA